MSAFFADLAPVKAQVTLYRQGRTDEVEKGRARKVHALVVFVETAETLKAKTPAAEVKILVVTQNRPPHQTYNLAQTAADQPIHMND
jgi:hypothetical protein